MKLEIQKAKNKHLRELAQLIVKTKIGENTIGRELKKLNKYKDDFWFVELNKKIIACVGVEFVDKNNAVITYLAVEKMYRKMGIGMTLFKYVLDYCGNNQVKRFGLVAMFYHFKHFKKFGFRTCPRIDLPKALKDHWMLSAKRYMKCAAMIKE